MTRRSAEPARTVGRASDIGLVGLRAEAPEECGPVVESIDLSGFEWHGITRKGRDWKRRPPPPAIRLNGKGMFRLNTTLADAVEATLRPDERVRVLVGVAPRAVAIRLVNADDPSGALLRFMKPSGAGRHGIFTLVGAQREIAKQGIALPITLDAVFYPEERIIYAKAPRAERGRGR